MTTPVVDTSNLNEKNLDMLKRVDKEVEQVLGNAAHVCLYVMSLETQQWERKNVEGSLFLLKRKTSPRFQIVVMNKLSTENYYETIHGGFEVEIQAPYLMYTQGDGKVHGIWFYEQQDLDHVAALLSRVKTGLPKPDILPSDTQMAEASATAAVAGAEDGAFWDKQGPSQAPAPAPAPTAAPANGGGNALTALFKNAQLKQAAPATAPSPVPAPVAASAPAPLPPSFFRAGSVPGPQAAMNKVLDDMRKPAALSPAPSSDHAAAAPKPATAPADNPLSKLFKAGMTGTAPPPAAPPPPTTNVLTSLFAGAAQKQQQAAAATPSVAAPRPAPAYGQPGTPPGHTTGGYPGAPLSQPPSISPQGIPPSLAQTMGHGQGGHPGAQPPPPPPHAHHHHSQQHAAAAASLRAAGHHQALKAALERLVARDEFVELLAQELRASNLLPQ